MPSAKEMIRKMRQQEDVLGCDIVDECRVQLMLKFRFLDRALWRMNLEPTRLEFRYALATTTDTIYVHAPRVIARYMDSYDELIRDYLHLILHCVFRHPFDRDHDVQEAWWLACDIVVEHLVMDMCGKRFPSVDDADRRRALDELELQCGILTPHRIYKLLAESSPDLTQPHARRVPRSKLNELHYLFERDAHDMWPATSDGDLESHDQEDGEEEGNSPQKETSPQNDPGDLALQPSATNQEDEQSGQRGGGEQDSQEDTADKDIADKACKTPESVKDETPECETHDLNETRDLSHTDNQQSNKEDTPDEIVGNKTEADDSFDQKDKDNSYDRQVLNEQEWEDISRQIEMDMSTFSKDWGHEFGNLSANLKIANRKKNDYTSFLRQFMTMNEEMKINQEEYDYIFYTYGLELYGNMPLVEPLEYKETHRIREFCIVIDTSESVSGTLVKRFLERTFEILHDLDSYTQDVTIHLIQCDAKVQSDIKITNLNDAEKLMADFEVKGLGGTDFRPAFDYVKHLREKEELRHLKGLIYFTDGWGTYPKEAPDFDVAFVFMDDESAQELPAVPPWAMRVIIDEKGITSQKPSLTSKIFG